MFSVLVAPKLRPLEKNVNVHSGDSVGITCTAIAGDPPIMFHWTMNGSPIISQSGVTIVQLNTYSSALAISEVFSEHAGRYSCSATNSLGFATTSLELVIYGNQNNSIFHQEHVICSSHTDAISR